MRVHEFDHEEHEKHQRLGGSAPGGSFVLFVWFVVQKSLGPGLRRDERIRRRDSV
jgi:hypothetical protein